MNPQSRKPGYGRVDLCPQYYFVCLLHGLDCFHGHFPDPGRPKAHNPKYSHLLSTIPYIKNELPSET
jgi:hypothetical protein